MFTNHTNEELLQLGIYRILNLSNNKSYIGSAISTRRPSRRGFRSRFMTHRRNLIDNKHHNQHLQNAFNKYGKDNFIFEILEIANPEDCDILEIKYIEDYKSMTYENGYNIIKQSLSRKGKTCSEEIKLKLSQLYKGKSRSLEIVKKYSNHVLQYDLNGNLINEYYSMSEASRQTGIQRQDIGQSIIGKKCKTAGGFIWKKRDEDIV